MQENTNIAQETSKTNENDKKKRLLLILPILLLIGLMAYGLYSYLNMRNEWLEADASSDKLIEKLNNEIAQLNDEIEEQDDEPTTDPEPKPETPTVVAKEKTGKIAFKTSYPSDRVPDGRVCFTNVADMSKIYCVANNKYSATLPVGKYVVDFSLYSENQGKTNTVLETYSLRQCVAYSNGTSSANKDKYCEKLTEYFTELDNAIKGRPYFNGYYLARSGIYNISQYGGEPLVYEVKEGKTTTIPHTLNFLPL